MFSDGSCTVDELIAGARAAGLTRIAITDHDCLSQLSFIRARSRELSFPVLAGVEVSAHDPATGRKVHVLGFGLEATADGSGPVERLVAPTLFARTATSLWQAWVLKREDVEFSGHRLSFDEVYDVARASTGIYKQHIMEALTRRPHTDPDYQFCYQCWFKGDSPANRTVEYPTAVEAVRAIREQGGMPVLAHPGQTKSWAIVPELVGAGLMGIEAFHPDHGPVEEGLAFELAERLGLFVTGGSDYHGKYGSSPRWERVLYAQKRRGARSRGCLPASPRFRSPHPRACYVLGAGRWPRFLLRFGRRALGPGDNLNLRYALGAVAMTSVSATLGSPVKKRVKRSNCTRSHSSGEGARTSSAATSSTEASSVSP